MRGLALSWGITGGGPLLVGLVFLAFVMVVTTLRNERPSTALQPVPGAPAPLYLGEGVSAERAEWALAAMQVVWDEVPRMTGLPLPASPTSVVLYRDAEQYRAQVSQWLGPGPEVERSTCLTSPDRVIYCDASSFRSRGDTIGALGQELTYQLVIGDLDRPRDVARWYRVGLAAHVGTELLAAHDGLNAAGYWGRIERRVSAALRARRYVPLELLEASEAWNDVADQDLAFGESALAVHRLAERFGMETVTRVVQRTGAEATFARAFGDEFGRSTEAFEAEFRAALLPNARRIMPRSSP
jgi:hypothetical protein